MFFKTLVTETDHLPVYKKNLERIQKQGISCRTERTKIDESRTIYRIYVNSVDYRKTADALKF